jgi:predicted ABC-type ATPase
LVTRPKIVIIAGPNGAGKTTFARAFLPQEAKTQGCINADLIAAGLSPFAPEAQAIKAGRLMLDEIAACVRRRESFAVVSKRDVEISTNAIAGP